MIIILRKIKKFVYIALKVELLPNNTILYVCALYFYLSFTSLLFMICHSKLVGEMVMEPIHVSLSPPFLHQVDLHIQNQFPLPYLQQPLPTLNQPFNIKLDCDNYLL